MEFPFGSQRSCKPSPIGIVRVGCEATGVHRSTVYGRPHSDEEFAAKWQEALDSAAHSLEAEAVRRATEGERTARSKTLLDLRKQSVQSHHPCPRLASVGMSHSRTFLGLPLG